MSGPLDGEHAEAPPHTDAEAPPHTDADAAAANGWDDGREGYEGWSPAADTGGETENGDTAPPLGGGAGGDDLLAELRAKQAEVVAEIGRHAEAAEAADPVEADPRAAVDVEPPTRQELDTLFAEGNLKRIREAAEYHMIAPVALLGLVAARLALRVPITEDGAGLLATPRMPPKPLNQFVLITGITGCGKSDGVGIARRLLPDKATAPLKVIRPASGEALIEAFGVAEADGGEEAQAGAIGKPPKTVKQLEDAAEKAEAAAEKAAEAALTADAVAKQAEEDAEPAAGENPDPTLKTAAKRAAAAANAKRAEAQSKKGIAEAKRRDANDAAKTESGEQAGKPVRVQHPRCLLVADELLGQLRSWNRQGVTTKTELRSAWSSAGLGAEVTAVKGSRQRVSVPEMSYRLSAVAAGTWLAAGELAELGEGGDAARWFILSGENPDQPDVPVDAEPPAPLHVVDWPEGQALDRHTIDGGVVDEVLARRLAASRGEREDSHDTQRRLRLAALIGWLRDHPGTLDGEDWLLAGIVMKADAWARAEAGRRCFAEKQEEFRERGRLQGEARTTQVKVEHEESRRRIRRMAVSALKHLVSGKAANVGAAADLAVRGGNYTRFKEKSSMLRQDLVVEVELEAEKLLKEGWTAEGEAR